MKLEEELEQQQYQNIYHEDDVPLTDISGKILKKLIYFGFALFGVLLIASLVIKIPREVNVQFELKGGLNELVMQFPEQTYIKKKCVATGQSVSKGTALIAITSPRIVQGITAITTCEQNLRINQKEQTYAHQQDSLLLVAQQKGMLSEIQLLEKVLSNTKNAATNEIKPLRHQLDIAEKQHTRNALLHAQKVISDLDLEASLQLVKEAEQKLINVQENYDRSISDTQSRLVVTHSSVEVIKKRLLKMKADHDLETARLIKELDLTKNMLRLNFGESRIEGNSIILLSPGDGRVTLITENENEVTSGEIILKLQHDSSAYFAYSEIAPKDRGQIKKGDKVVLKYQSFPHYYYGTMIGEIATISESPNAVGNYLASIKIVDHGKLLNEVTKGMTGAASIIIEEKSVFDFIFRMFLKGTSIN